MSYININRAIRTPRTLDAFAVPENDADRLNALRRLKIFDTSSEEIFSAYTELAGLTFRTPIALMSFVEEDTVHYKEAFGVERTGQKVARKNSPCSIAIMSKEVSQFRYALTDPCVIADENSLAEAGYKFYTGVPLVTQDQFSIGLLAVVDRVPRTYTDQEVSQLHQLASEVMNEIELRLKASGREELLALNRRLKMIHARVEALRS